MMNMKDPVLLLVASVRFTKPRSMTKKKDVYVTSRVRGISLYLPQSSHVSKLYRSIRFVIYQKGSVVKI